MESAINCSKNEDGFVLVVAMVMMVILTMLGTFALNSTNFEMQIAGNDKVSKEIFYRAESGVQSGFEVLEQNLGCPGGFTTSTPFNMGGINIFDSFLAYHEDMKDINGATTAVTLPDLPSDVIRAMRILNDPGNGNDTTAHTNVVAWGQTEYLPGSGLQMAAGYEGKGKGAGGGGAVIKYQVHSQHMRPADSESKIAANWFHVIGQQGACNY